VTREEIGGLIALALFGVALSVVVADGLLRWLR